MITGLQAYASPVSSETGPLVVVYDDFLKQKEATRRALSIICTESCAEYQNINYCTIKNTVFTFYVHSRSPR